MTYKPSKILLVLQSKSQGYLKLWAQAQVDGQIGGENGLLHQFDHLLVLVAFNIRKNV